jgi:hypothetical protein
LVFSIAIYGTIISHLNDISQNKHDLKFPILIRIMNAVGVKRLGSNKVPDENSESSIKPQSSREELLVRFINPSVEGDLYLNTQVSFSLENDT